MAVLSFDNKSEWADAKLYNDNEELIAEGKYKNKEREGTWIYFEKEKKMIEEIYTDGKKNGISRFYYKPRITIGFFFYSDFINTSFPNAFKIHLLFVFQIFEGPLT